MAETKGLIPEEPALIVTFCQLMEGYKVRERVRCRYCGHEYFQVRSVKFEVLAKLRDGNFAVKPMDIAHDVRNSD